MAERATAVNCIDGRTQRPVLDHVATRFGARNIDLVTAPGAVRHLAAEPTAVGTSLIEAVRVSMTVNESTQIAVVAHQDCRGNPVPDRTQEAQLVSAAATLRLHFPEADVVALFLDLKSGFRRVD
jgi:hypothetical protein